MLQQITQEFVLIGTRRLRSQIVFLPNKPEHNSEKHLITAGIGKVSSK